MARFWFWHTRLASEVRRPPRGGGLERSHIRTSASRLWAVSLRGLENRPLRSPACGCRPAPAALPAVWPGLSPLPWVRWWPGIAALIAGRMAWARALAGPDGSPAAGAATCPLRGAGAGDGAGSPPYGVPPAPRPWVARWVIGEAEFPPAQLIGESIYRNRPNASHPPPEILAVLCQHRRLF